jgi:hypothetical protein
VNPEPETKVILHQPANEVVLTTGLSNKEPLAMTAAGEEKAASIERKVDLKELISIKDAAIEISNGNGARRMAQKVGDYLKEKGLKVTRLTNASHFSHPGTKIIYQKSYDQAAEQVAEHLPVYRTKEEIESFDRPNIRIKILIGKDLVPHHKIFENGKTS